MDLLPAGMERRKLNQSYWEPKSHSAFLTIEFKLHPPRDPLAPSSQSAGPPLVLLTHKNKMDSSLLKLAQQAADRVLSKKDGATNGWLRRFLFPDPDNPSSFTPPHFIMAAKMKPRSAAFQKSHHRAAYYRFDPSESFATLLRNTSFVEFPTIEVWEEFTGTVVNVQGTVTELPADDEPNAKRRKLSRKAGKEAINGLLGDYGSEEDEEVALAPANGLALLDGYAESDAGEGDIAGDGDDDAIRDDALQGSDDEVEVELDAEALLELMRHAHGEERWAEKIRLGEEVDWGASGDEEP
ncbi:hypothetical protein H0H92_004772 [Tricholoma furcatifolium]|nr:hypothetical protein H0H92_004772 [Tricholoma furcatifolium]